MSINTNVFSNHVGDATSPTTSLDGAMSLDGYAKLMMMMMMMMM